MGKKFSSEYQPQKRRTGAPQIKTAMIKAIEKRFPRGTAEFCEKVLEIGLTEAPALLNECLKRIEPPLKPSGVTVNIEIPEGATAKEKAECIFDAVALGDITLEAGQMMIGMIKDSLDIEERTELHERVKALEALVGKD